MTCETCQGAGYVRNKKGEIKPCPRWDAKRRRCVEPQGYQVPAWAR